MLCRSRASRLIRERSSTGSHWACVPCRETTISRHLREPVSDPNVSRPRHCRELASENYDGKPTHAGILDGCSSATRASRCSSLKHYSLCPVEGDRRATAAPLSRAIGIVRVSRQNRNEDSRESPEVQRRLITRFVGAQGQGWDLIEILDENELRNGDVSGGADISKRLGFSAAIKRIVAGKADVIVVADHGRLFRDIDLQPAAIDRVEAAGGQLWAVSERSDHAQDGGRRADGKPQGLYRPLSAALCP